MAVLNSVSWTLWLSHGWVTNIAVENDTFEVDFSSKNGDVPKISLENMVIYQRGFPMAM